MIPFAFNQPQPMPPDEKLMEALRDALAWGRAYGPVINLRQWDDMRDAKARQIIASLKKHDPTPTMKEG